MSGNYLRNEFSTGSLIRYVSVDSSVLMKISNHQSFSTNHQGWGQLLGWVKSDHIELTNSYPLLEVNDESYEEETNNYERTLTSVNQNFNIDNNKVGWYYISNSNDYLSSDVFYSNLNYGAKKMYSIFMVYDTVEARSGSSCPFKAYFISEAWMKIVKQEEMDLDITQLKAFNLKFDKMYTEINLQIVANPLTKLFLTQHEKDIRKTLDSKRAIDMDQNLTNNVKNMGESLDELNQLILTLHENKKNNVEKSTNNSNMVDFMGIILKGLNFTNRIKDNTEYNLSNIKLAEHFNNSSK